MGCLPGGRGGSSTRKKNDEAEASTRPQEVVLEDVTSKSAAIVIASSSTPPVHVHRLNLQQSRTNQVRSLEIRAVGSGDQGVNWPYRFWQICRDFKFSNITNMQYRWLYTLLYCHTYYCICHTISYQISTIGIVIHIACYHILSVLFSYKRQMGTPRRW